MYDCSDYAYRDLCNSFMWVNNSVLFIREVREGFMATGVNKDGEFVDFNVNNVLLRTPTVGYTINRHGYYEYLVRLNRVRGCFKRGVCAHNTPGLHESTRALVCESLENTPITKDCLVEALQTRDCVVGGVFLVKMDGTVHYKGCAVGVFIEGSFKMKRGKKYLKDLIEGLLL